MGVGRQRRQRAAEERTEGEPEAEAETDETHAAGAPLGRRYVGDVRLRDRDVRGREAREDAGREQQDQRVGEAEQHHARGGGGDAGEQDRSAPDPVGEAPPDRDEQELHQRVHRARQGRDEVAGAEVTRHAREEGDDHPETQEIDEDGEEDRAERSFAHQGRRGR